jgi:tetratricopeptide (TPR) repeat protein
VAIASRIDALPAEERAALLDASVVGKVFWRGSLEAMDHHDVAETLDALEARDLIRRERTSSMSGDAEYTFRHVLIRDVAYGTLRRPDRRTRHTAVAHYLERMAGEQVRDIAWLLAHHWREAGESSRAVEYLLIAAEAARDSWAVEEAIRLYDSAVELAGDDESRVRIRLLRGLALVRLEEYEQAEKDLGELLPELDGLDEVEALLGRGRAAQWTEQTEVAIASAEQAIALAERVGSRELLAPAHGRLSQAVAMRGDAGDLDRATEIGDRALEMWIPRTRLDELAEHNVMHAHTYYWTGRFDEAVGLARAGRTVAVDSGSREALLRGGTLEGASLAAMGRYEEALAVFDERIALAREMGRPVRVISNYSTVALRDIYDIDEARRRNEEALDGMAWTSFNMPWQNALVDHVFNDLLAGDVGAAQTRWPQVWDDVSKGKAWQRWMLVGKMTEARAEIELETGRYEVAAEWAIKAIEMAKAVGHRKYEIAARIVLGSALVGMRKATDAVEHLRTAVTEADELGTPPGRWRARAALGRALAAIDRDDEVGRLLAEAAEIIEAVASTLAPERAERFLGADAVRQILSGGV